MMDDLPPILTVEEVAAYLRVDRKKVYDLIKSDQIRSLKLGRALRVPRSALPASMDAFGAIRPNEKVPAGRFALLYRCYGIDDELLYVGVTTHGWRRLSAHAEKGWFEREVLIVTFERVSTSEAVLLEAAAIEAGQPKYNVTHNGRRKVEVTQAPLRPRGGPDGR